MPSEVYIKSIRSIRLRKLIYCILMNPSSWIYKRSKNIAIIFIYELIPRKEWLKENFTTTFYNYRHLGLVYQIVCNMLIMKVIQKNICVI